MTEIDYIDERHKLLTELRHHHTYPTYVALDEANPDRPRWKVGGEQGTGCPETWAGLPIVYVSEGEIPSRSTREWLRETNPLAPHDDPGAH